MIDPDILKEEYEVFYAGHRYKITRIEEYYHNENQWEVRCESITNGYGEVFYVLKKTLVGSDDEDSPVRLRKKARQEPKTVFHIRAGRENWEKDEWVKLETVEDLEEAKAKIATHSRLVRETDSPWRFMMKGEQVMSDIFDYDQWADFRFQVGEWEKLPWANEEWADREETRHHFAHFAKSRDPGVAFWETPEKAQSDSVSVLSVGGYLRRFYSDVLAPEQIEDWVTRSDPPGDLKISGSTPDEIYQAYRDSKDSSHSCMIYADDGKCHDGINWRSGKNPVRIFGAGDLAVATLWRRGKCAARALVWPEKKVAGRRYGDVKRMTMALEAAGYEIDGNGNDMHTEGTGLFEGARMLREVPEDHPGNLIAPYLDLHYRVKVHADHLTLTRDAANNSDVFAACRTDGLLLNSGASLGNPDEDSENFCCPRCDDWEPVEDARCVLTGPGRYEDWCCHCADEHTYTCEACHDMTQESYTTHTEDDCVYCNECASNRVTTCDSCLDTYSNGNIAQVYDAELPDRDPESWCHHCREDDVVMHNDRLTAASTITECDECGENIPADRAICNSCELESEAA